MGHALRISEAASIALHTMVALARRPEETTSARAIAGRLGVSQAHLSKVLQRLARAGLLDSTRGPGGGFRLSTTAADCTLLDVYEAVEGTLEAPECLLRRPICDGESCLLGGLLADINREVGDRLRGIRLSVLLRHPGKSDEEGDENAA